MIKVNKKDLFVSFDEVAEFSTGNRSFRFGTFKIGDINVSHIWLEVTIRELTLQMTPISDN